MSSTSNASSPLSKFETIFDTALAQYAKRTGEDLRNHPLAATIDRCDSPDSVLAIFQAQSQAFDQFRNGDPKLIKSLGPVVNGLHALSNNTVLSAGASLAFPPAKLIFSGIGVLLSSAKIVRDSYDTLLDIFECIENFTSRLKIYTETQPTPAMIETMVKIMAELLAVLALATKQIKQGRLKKFARKLLGEKDIESVLQRLDRLTLEESRMTVTQTLDVVYGLVNNMEVVMEDGKTSTDDIRGTLVFMQEITMKINKIERDQLQGKFRSWLSPPDPWSNYNNAREAHHPGTATWFIQGDTFGKWKSTGSLLWVNGLPGSGKTIFSSSIIKDLQDMCRTGLANLAIFYFHFGDTTKQDARNLLSSVLIQLCSQSDTFSEALSSIYSFHGNGFREPSIDTLLECLKEILAIQGQAPLYIVIDALDECPHSSGLRTQREEVLEIVKELIDLKLPHLHFCVTSRPEIDIRTVFDPLSPYNVPLHNQAGQIKDLAEYVKSVVGSDVKMQNWPAKVRELVIDTLAQKGGGMFRWAYCQLETLRQCPLRYISSTLDELPETLDETYERILQGIPKKMQKDAHRIFQWLTVSSRPLRVQELAEVFAINFDEELSGIPKFEPSWRDPNAEIAVLSACSTLVTIVDDRWRRKVVQFSHFSVQEYLTSDRIANAEHGSGFHIHPEPAHTLLAKACLSVLFQLDYCSCVDIIENFPLAMYAAKHWVEHARFEDVSSYIRDGMDLLFEEDKPHFVTWVWVYNMDRGTSHYSNTGHPEQPDPVPLYYAALCGISGLVERLLTAHPEDLNAEGGFWGTPLNAALAHGHLNIALFLLNRGAYWENRGIECQTALFIASSRGYADFVRSLIERGADLNAECQDWIDGCVEAKWTSLLVAIFKGRRDIAILLLERGADTEIRSSRDQTALYLASSRGHADVVRSLIDRGADLNAICKDYDDYGYTNDAKLTPLHVSICKGHRDIALLLVEAGANLNAKSQDWLCDSIDMMFAPLHTAIDRGHRDIVLLLLEAGADMETRCASDKTALHMASSSGSADIVRQLVIHGADLNAKCIDSSRYNEDVKWSPLHVASCEGTPPIVRVLLEHGANPNAPDHFGETALHVASWRGDVTVAELLLEYGANVDVRDSDGWTPLHKAAHNVSMEVVDALLNRGADPHAQTDRGETPLQLANKPFFLRKSREDQAKTIRLLSERTGERM